MEEENYPLIMCSVTESERFILLLVSSHFNMGNYKQVMSLCDY